MKILLKSLCIIWPNKIGNFLARWPREDTFTMNLLTFVNSFNGNREPFNFYNVLKADVFLFDFMLQKRNITIC